ncbi:hypothetical protein RI129_003294 [Pyrocoelia pectoralis]|uniref:Regulatory protein zeste n=1 Tax=Pyrocoelia pectoralis TaxID=417401 RepID=A0AAN7VHT9_9COLE
MSEQKKYITPSEKIFVTELVSKHKNIVECKKMDVVNAAEKKKTWTLITTEFNSVPDHTKVTNSTTTSKAWENIKCRRKKELSKEKRERMATGGGVIKAPPTDDAVDGILDCVDIEIKDVIDSDETMLSINYALVDNNLVPIEISEVQENEPHYTQSKNESATNKNNDRQSQTTKITNLMNKTKPVSINKSKQFDEQLIKLIVKEYHPLSIVDVEFRKFKYEIANAYLRRL